MERVGHSDLMMDVHWAKPRVKMLASKRALLTEWQLDHLLTD